MSDFTDEHRAMLDFESTWWSYPGSKAAGIRDRFSMSSTKYHLELNAVIEMPEALDHAPMVVKRLHRQRTLRRHERRSSRIG
ncbi:DUF3263 domain-containing protein [Nocardioides marmorisolisilvae]|uniref:DUF3263 domain-containing protein n=1 Tax=Nocardioides marmorisolisilvae TaxID=1542737 RepID=A0A3N0DTE6_9ACTN|nr:DUF3263 domain-containing protein [Nocardioides marmorisolisilvae]RNL78781.1 DUF3263 domain-containing protein [Nocardioides marmorisolisilvae]